MQFSTTPNPQIKKQTWWERFKSQAHQLFFVQALIFAILLMSLSFFILSGHLNINFVLIHSFGLIFAFFTNAFLGFLITVIPKFNNSKPISEKEYLFPWAMFQLSLLITLFINEHIGKILCALVILYFVVIFYTYIKKGNNVDKKDSIYTNFFLLNSSILLIIEAIFHVDLSQLIFYTYLLPIVFLIALRMVPAFYFTYTRIPPWQRPKYLREISMILFIALGLSIQFEQVLLVKFLSFIAFVFFTYIIIKLNFYKKTTPILLILTYSFFWLELGFFALFLESFFEIDAFKLSLHIFSTGFITTIFIGFATRVCLGHAVPPRPITADKQTIYLFIFTQLIVLLRIFSSITFLANIDIFMKLVYASSIFWVVLFILWALKYARILLRV